jgi:hypothetical protein
VANFIEHEARLGELWTPIVLCGLLWPLVPAPYQKSTRDEP